MSVGKLACHDQGATGLEYGLIAGLIALGLVGSLVSTKSSLSDLFGRSAAAVGNSAASSPAVQAPTVATASTADGQPGVAKLDFAAKGAYVKKVVYSGCDLGRCGMANLTEYRYADGSFIDYQPAGNGNEANYKIYDTAGSTTKVYYLTSPTGDGHPGDTLAISGTVGQQSFKDTLAFNTDGSVTGTRTYTTGGTDATVNVSTTQQSDYGNLYAATAFARALR